MAGRGGVFYGRRPDDEIRDAAFDRVVLSAGVGRAGEMRPVEVSAAEMPGFPLDSVVRLPAVAGQGWRIGETGLAREPFAVFVPEAPVSAGQLLMELEFPGPEPEDYFGRFGVDVTTDAPPVAEGTVDAIDSVDRHRADGALR